MKIETKQSMVVSLKCLKNNNSNSNFVEQHGQDEQHTSPQHVNLNVSAKAAFREKMER